MSDDDNARYAADLVELVASGADEGEIQSKARAIKAEIMEEYLILWRAVTLVDSLVGVYAFDPTWQHGFTTQQANLAVANIGQQGQPKSARGKRVLEIAQGMVDSGAKTVISKAIAEQLSRDGETASLKDLATSAGNTLARSDIWERVRPGEYQPRSAQQEEAAVVT